jgi:hypothetical protein
MAYDLEHVGRGGLWDRGDIVRGPRIHMRIRPKPNVETRPKDETFIASARLLYVHLQAAKQRHIPQMTRCNKGPYALFVDCNNTCSGLTT